MTYICQKCNQPCTVSRDVYPARGLFTPPKVYVWSRCCDAAVERAPIAQKDAPSLAERE